MDRREALKKISAGGAVAIGTTAVLSSPAFAYTLPTVSGTPTMSIATIDLNSATLTVSAFPVGTCPASATDADGSSPGVQASSGSPNYSWTVTRPVGTNTGSGTWASTPYTANIERGTGPWNAGTLIGLAADTISVTVRRAYTCTYGAGSATRCVSWTQLFTASGTFGSATWSGGPITTNTSAIGCA